MTRRSGADSRVALYHILPTHRLTEQTDLLVSQEEGGDAAPQSLSWYGEIRVSEGEHVAGSPCQVEIVGEVGHPGCLLLPPHGVSPVEPDDSVTGLVVAQPDLQCQPVHVPTVDPVLRVREGDQLVPTAHLRSHVFSYSMLGGEM